MRNISDREVSAPAVIIFLEWGKTTTTKISRGRASFFHNSAAPILNFSELSFCAQQFVCLMGFFVFHVATKRFVRCTFSQIF